MIRRVRSSRSRPQYTKTKAPLRLMGAEVDAREGRFPPFTVRGGRLRGIDYELPSAGAPVKACVLIADPQCPARIAKDCPDDIAVEPFGNRPVLPLTVADPFAQPMSKQTEPHEPLFIHQDGGYGVIGQPVRFRKDDPAPVLEP